MKLLESTKNKITKDESDENEPYLEITPDNFRKYSIKQTTNMSIFQC